MNNINGIKQFQSGGPPAGQALKINTKSQPVTEDLDSFDLLDAPQKSLIYLLTGDYNKPSEHLYNNGALNPIKKWDKVLGSFFDLALDPLNFIPEFGVNGLKGFKPYKKLNFLINSTQTINSAGDIKNNIEKKQYGGINNIDPKSLEGNLIAKVILNRNQGLNTVERAVNPELYPERGNPDGSYSTHLMSYFHDGPKAQAYMEPTLFYSNEGVPALTTVRNTGEEVMKIPNNYAEYISSIGYKKAAEDLKHSLQKKQYGGLYFKPDHYEAMAWVESHHNDKQLTSRQDGVVGPLQLTEPAFNELKKLGYFKDKDFKSLTPVEGLAGGMKYSTILAENYGFKDGQWNIAAYNMGPTKATNLYRKYDGDIYNAMKDEDFPQTTKNYIFDYNAAKALQIRKPKTKYIKDMYDIIVNDKDLSTYDVKRYQNN